MNALHMCVRARACVRVCVCVSVCICSWQYICPFHVTHSPRKQTEGTEMELLEERDVKKSCINLRVRGAWRWLKEANNVCQESF